MTNDTEFRQPPASCVPPGAAAHDENNTQRHSLEVAEAALAGELELPSAQREDPDLSLTAYLRWCARQPPTPEDTLAAWRRGNFSLSSHRDAREEASCA